MQILEVKLKMSKLCSDFFKTVANSNYSINNYSINSTLEETLNNFKLMGTEIILMGDFNVDFTRALFCRHASEPVRQLYRALELSESFEKILALTKKTMGKK